MHKSVQRTDFAKHRIYVLTSQKTNITADTWTAEVPTKTTTIYTIEGLDEDKDYYVYVTAVDADGNEITNTVTGVAVTTTPSEGLSTTTLAMIGGLIALTIVVVAALMLMCKKKGQAPVAEPEKKEE